MLIQTRASPPACTGLSVYVCTSHIAPPLVPEHRAAGVRPHHPPPLPITLPDHAAAFPGCRVTTVNQPRSPAEAHQVRADGCGGSEQNKNHIQNTQTQGCA